MSRDYIFKVSQKFGTFCDEVHCRDWQRWMRFSYLLITNYELIKKINLKHVHFIFINFMLFWKLLIDFIHLFRSCYLCNKKLDYIIDIRFDPPRCPACRNAIDRAVIYAHAEIDLIKLLFRPFCLLNDGFYGNTATFSSRNFAAQ